MNYIQELNAFYEWLDSNPMPASAISLWHTLMQINNRCRWCGEFTVAISTLVSKTGSQRSAVFQSRKLLIAKGRLKCTTNGSSFAATYSMIPFSTESDRQGGDSDKSTRPVNRDPENRDRANHDPADSDQPNRDRANRDNESGNVAAKSADGQTGQRTPNAPNSKQNEIKQNSIKEPKGSTSSGDDPKEGDDLQVSVERIFDDYNRLCKNLPKAKVLTARRRQMLGARLHEHGYQNILLMLRNAGASNFLAGANNRKWIATFDWLFGPCNFAKVLEGNYENGRFASRDNSAYVGKPSPIELIEEAYNGIMKDGYEY